MPHSCRNRAEDRRSLAPSSLSCGTMRSQLAVDRPQRTGRWHPQVLSAPVAPVQLHLCPRLPRHTVGLGMGISSLRRRAGLPEVSSPRLTSPKNPPSLKVSLKLPSMSLSTRCGHVGRWAVGDGFDIPCGALACFETTMMCEVNLGMQQLASGSAGW